jgi:hypothetical protein
MKLRATFRNSYRNSNGNIRYVYELTGSQDAIEQYLQDRRDEGYPSVNAEGEEEPVLNNGKIIPNGTWVERTDNGKWFPNLFELEALNSLKEQFPHLDDATLKSFITPTQPTKVAKHSEQDVDLDV